ncbi:hypothetical protein [Halorussus pelagicus]|uniref:hypothetical protein n=1 Tax=Halorussus pelagicus TaxID=2505977 RepID=UPI000FFC7959|nr:hypothetical protein [Halorussus pelagicus]
MSEDSTYGDGTEGFFGFVVGLYAAAVAVPAVTIAFELAATPSPGTLFFVLLGSTVLVAYVVGLFGRRESLAVRLGGTRSVWAALVPPLGYLVALFVSEVVRGEAPPGAVAGVAFAGALAGLVAGLGLIVASHNRYVKARLADAPVDVAFSARAPKRDRTRIKWTVVALFVGGVLCFVGEILLHFDPLRWLFQLLVPMAAGLYGGTTEREIRISSAGLIAGSPAHKQLRPWSEFESYDVADDAVVVRRAGWSPWGLRDVRRDASDVEDPEAVADALGRFLPRHE